MTAGLPWSLLRKEFRALLPWWASSAGVLMLSWILRTSEWARFFSDSDYMGVGLWAYAIGAVVLGAMAVGQEFTHNTLAAVLLQPVSRHQLLLAKAIPLALLLASLAVLASFSLGLNMFDGGPRGLTIAWLPVACGFCLAPWLTMLSRGALGGAVYSFLVPSLLFVAGGYLNIPHTAVAPLIVGLGIVSLILTAYTFSRLEVSGTARTEVDLLAWLPRTQRRFPAAGRHPLWVLLTKELRLQQVTLLAGMAYVTAWILIGAASPWMRETRVLDLRYAATMLFAGLAAVLPGALVSAEERRFNTADWHTLLPTGSGLQWVIKVGTALVLTVGLAVGLPALLDGLSSGPAIEEAFSPLLAASVCIAAVYISSLSRNGLHALLATVPAITVGIALWLGMVALTVWLATPFADVIRESLLEPLIRFSRTEPALWRQLRTWVPLSCLGILLITLTARNHVTADRSRARVLTQAAWILATAWGSALLLILVDATRGMMLRP